ncbi:HlyD family secretion protein [Haliea sp. E17]|uniref:HlyD family secretion protein n=1 Tax=Haliea sp. E17 TaxID=3401576 RepID=UPI003AAEB865
MSESNPTTPAPDAAPAPANEAPPPPPSTNRGVLVVLVLLLVSLAWYLLADRFTPYTSQARVQGYVVGVAPKVAGVITAIHVENNTRVQQGQKLFSIDRSQYDIALQSALSNLDNTRQQVSAGDAAVEQARANLVAAEAGQLKAQQDYSRLKRLREDDPGTISERRLEISSATLAQTRAQVAAAVAGVQRAIEQKGGDSDDSGNTLLQAAQAAVDKAQLDLDNTTVVAQSDGVITDLRADVGQFAGTGSPVLTLVAVQQVWINADYTENNLGHLKPGTPVEILLDSMPGQVFGGRVRDIGVGVSAGSPPPPGALPSVQNNRDWLRQAQRFPVQVDFTESPSPEILRNLRLGGQASVIAYSEGHWLLRMLGKAYIRVLSVLSYAY